MKNLVHRLEIFLLTIQRTLKLKKTSTIKNIPLLYNGQIIPKTWHLHMKNTFSIFNGHFLRELGSVIKEYFLIYSGHLSVVCPEKYKKPPVSEKAGGAEKRLILSFRE